MMKVFLWVYNRIGLQTLITSSLILFALYALTSGMGVVVKGLNANSLYTLVVLCALLVWLLARSSLAFPWAVLVTLLLGLLALPLRLGRIANPLFALLLTIKDLAAGFIRWQWRWSPGPHTPPETGPFLVALNDFQVSLAALANRIGAWASGLAHGGDTSDSVVTALIWGLVLWLLAAWAVWSTRRRNNALHGFAPAFILLAAFLTYVRAPATSLLWLLGTVLLLIVIVNYKSHEQSWDARHIDYSVEIRLDLLVVTLPLVLAIMGLAAIAPSLSIKKVMDFARSLTEKPIAQVDPIGKSIGLERGRLGEASQGPIPSLPNQHLLGAGPDLAQRVVMRISTGEFSPRPAISLESISVPRYYWRAYTFDTYTGIGWVNSQTNAVDYRANEADVASHLPYHRSVNLKVEGIENLNGILYTTGVLVSADQNYKVAWRIPFDVRADKLGPDGSLAVDANGATISANSYQVKALLPDVSQVDLRAAGVNYPDWVKSRYLGLPTSITPALRNLAKQLTGESPTPYDAAMSIETYLRQFPYSLDVPKPPVQRDVADYFIFDLKRSYCDYYSTSMVVLARLSGIPARLVIGYANGSYIPERAYYEVTEADAHSWPELYFPGIGWVEFEPTAGMPEIVRPEMNFTAPPVHREPLAEKPKARPQVFWLVLVGGLVAFVLWILFTWQRVDEYLFLRLPPARAAQRLYNRMRRGSRPLAVQVRPGQTPYEYTRSLAQPIQSLSRNRLFGRQLSPALKEVDQLVELYTRAVYSPHAPSKTDQSVGLMVWNRLRWRLWLARQLNRLGGKKKKGDIEAKSY